MQSDRFGELVHDMRNRLTVAAANIEAFIDGKLPPSRERLDAVLQALTQINELLKDLRVDAPLKQQHVHAEEIDVCALLAREYRAVEAMAVAKGITFNIFRCPIPSAACTHFVGDPVRIGQVASNLLLNAIRYTPAGGTVTVDCGRHGGELQIAITDTGPGVEPGETQKIFELGYRGSASGGSDGSGYGLAIVKEFVEAHGGKVTVDSVKESGATFSVRLPGTPVCAPGTDSQCASCVAAHDHVQRNR